jgi:hypothetical protein
MNKELLVEIYRMAEEIKNSKAVYSEDQLTMANEVIRRDRINAIRIQGILNEIWVSIPKDPTEQSKLSDTTQEVPRGVRVPIDPKVPQNQATGSKNVVARSCAGSTKEDSN